MNLPLYRGLRQSRGEAGLAGKDPLSEYLKKLEAAGEALHVAIPTLMQLRTPRRDHLALAIIGGLFVAAMAGGFVGYRYGRYAVVAECSQRVFPTSQGTACIMWPISR